MSLEDKLRRFAGWAGLLVAGLGAVALAGWASKTDPLAALRIETLPVKANACLGLLLTGASLWLQHHGRFTRAGRACAGLALGLCAASMAESLTGVNLGIDEFLFLDRPANFPLINPGRMSLHSAFALAVAATALLFLQQKERPQRWPTSAWLAVMVMAFAAASLAGLLFKGLVNFEVAHTLRIGTQLAGALLVLGVGILCARPDDRLMRLMVAPTSAGVLARRFFFCGAILPALGCAALIEVLHLRLMPLADGVVLLIMGLVLSGFVMALFSANAAAALDDRREDAERGRQELTARLQEQAAQLQETVAQRTRELREANASLRLAAESNARLALVASHTKNGVIIANADGLTEWVNAAFERMSGYVLAEIRGRKPGAVLQGPDTDHLAAERLRLAVRRGERCTVEVLNYHKHGRPYWQIVEIEPVRDQTGKLINFISIQTDVTEARLDKERLRALNQRLELATRTAELGVWEWEAAPRKFSWDDRMLVIHGIPRAAFTGEYEQWTQGVHPDDIGTAIGGFDAIFNGADEYEREFRLIHPADGAIRHVQARGLAQRAPEGRLLRITGTSRDITAERLASQQLALLNERLRLALRSSNYGVWELDATTQKLVWDDRMFEIYGLTRDEANSDRKVWSQRLHPQDRAQAESLASKVLSSEVPSYDTEFRILHPDGSIRHIEAHGYLQCDSQGRPIRLVGLNRDITGEKKTLEALRVAEERWQLAIEGTNDAVWDWDVPTGQIYHDQRWARMMGYEANEISNDLAGWNGLVHPDDLAGCETATLEHFAQRTPLYQHEHRMRARNGEWKWILDRGKAVTRAADGSPLRMVGTHTDITARKRLEQRLRQVEELAVEVSQLAQIGGWEIDLATSRVTWSSGVRALHELDEGYQPTLASILDFYPAEARASFEAALRGTSLRGATMDLELPLITAKGRTAWVRVLGRTEFQHGRPVRIHGAMQDVTVRHDSEEARRQLESRLFQAQKFETLGTLAGGIAHDFNNLLTGIIGYHELAADSLPEDHPARACLTEARVASMRARELVDQILTFGRQSAGEEHGPLDLTLVIDEARRFLRATLPANVTIETDFDPTCGQVLADATQIHQVLINLGSNAAHAMRPRGGTLRVSLAPARLDTEKAGTLGVTHANSYVRLSVRDNGHGMDAATIGRIFDPFFTTKNTGEGTGLGLAVVHGIVRSHHGVIDVASEVGVGTTFHVYLPAAGEKVIRVEPGPAEVPRGDSEFICVVDDEEFVASCTKLALENKGYRVMVFGSAEACLEELRSDFGGCALLLTDQTMPGMQGTELAAAVRALKPGLPVVIMSGYFSKIPAKDLDELGKVELLAKPFTTAELAQSVHRSLHPPAG